MKTLALRMALTIFALFAAQQSVAQQFNHIKLTSEKVENSAKFKQGNPFQKDILLFVDMLRSTHPAFGGATKRPFNIDSLENAAYKWAKQCTSVGQLSGYIQAIASRLGDGHTAVMPNFMGSQLYPFMFVNVGDQYYLQTTSSEYESSLGKQIVRINGAPIEEVIDGFRSSLSYENDTDFMNRLRKQLAFCSMWDNTKYTAADSTLTLLFADQTSIVIHPIKTIQKNLLVTLKPEVQQEGIREMSMMPFSYKIIEDRGICFLQFQTCQDQNSMRWSLSMQGNLSKEKIEQYISRYPCFDKFLDEMFTQIEAKKIKKLVIDVRDNGGGNSALCDVLLSWLKPVNEIKTGGSTVRMSALWALTYSELAASIKKSLGKNYRDGMVCSGHEISALLASKDSSAAVDMEQFFKKNLDASRVFKGDVVFIQNEGTYSSAGMLITAAVDNNIGMVLGSSSAYRPSNFGDMLAWQLPNTEIRGFVSHKLFHRPDTSKNDEPSIVPDVVVAQTWADVRNMRDVYWEWLIKD